MGLIVTITCADEVRREKSRFSRPVILRVFPHNPQIAVVHAATDNVEAKARCKGATADRDIAVATRFIRVTNSTGEAPIPPGGKTGGYAYVHGCTIIFRKRRERIV
jgi:hypothetical protein